MSNDNITSGFAEKAKGKAPEEIVALAQEEGIELTDEQLEAVSGGWVGKACPSCGSEDVGFSFTSDYTYGCNACGYRW